MSWSEKVSKEQEAMKVQMRANDDDAVVDNAVDAVEDCADMVIMTTKALKVWEEMRAVLPEEVTKDWGHFVEIFGRFFQPFLFPLIIVFVTSRSNNSGVFQVYGEWFHNQLLGGELEQCHGEGVGDLGMGTLSRPEHPRSLLLPHCKGHLERVETGGAQS